MAELIGPVNLLLASETIYNESCIPHLLDTITSCLAVDGMALVAAKSVYFGVGGGVESFKRAISQAMKCRTLFESDIGIKRVIMELRPASSAS